MPEVDLVLTANERSAPTDPDVMLCLDFGTAMSKAFASVQPDEHLELELGVAAGRTGHALPSSVFVGDNGKAYFGFEAIDRSQELIESGRERLDSIKGWLSLRREGDLDGELCVLSKALNPTAFKLTQGDLIRIYLAYLTDMAGMAMASYSLEGKKIQRYALRRFARPCWPDQAQAKWADALMRTMLAEAQILADTFSGRWAGGIDVAELKAAVEKLKRVGKMPDYLIADGVPEPVAVAAGAFEDMENLRDAFMVVDVGAGTTDFGLFVSTRRPGEEEVRVFQVPASIQGLMQAGDKVDGMLRVYIAQKESIDTADNAGRMNMAALGLQIRSLKETLFKAGKLEYVLADGTVGQVGLEEFLADERVQRFGSLVEKGFVDSLRGVDASWLRWLSAPGVSLRVVLTGGSSQLPMMKAMAKGPIQINGFEIRREEVSPRPQWMEDVSEELQAMYPQLAVAIGGSAENMPEALTAPPVFGGGTTQSQYVAGRMQVTGA
ncbi:MAG: hypothetical protein C4535_12075 [Comamonadaceae bacterium]|nr:MAG: hypothetical protein C4535_12075 [Comamonadaceae bacterium]